MSTVGISAVNMRKSIQKKRQPALLNALDDSLPIPKYNSPMRMPTLKWEISRNRVNVWKREDAVVLIHNELHLRISHCVKQQSTNIFKINYISYPKRMISLIKKNQTALMLKPTDIDRQTHRQTDRQSRFTYRVSDYGNEGSIEENSELS